MTDTQRRILLVEDEESLAESIRYTLEQEGFTVTVAVWESAVPAGVVTRTQ